MTPEEELKQLLERTGATLSANKQFVPTAIATAFVQLGGSVQDARRIAQLVVRMEIEKELDKADFPGPDQMWDLIEPWIKDKSEEFVGKFFDKVISGKHLFTS